MFGLDSEVKLKNYIRDINHQISLLVVELKSLKEKEKQLSKKISVLTNDDDDFNKYLDDISQLQKDEISVIRTDDDNLSDPVLKDTALDDLDEKDKVFEDEIKQFDEDESKIEIIEETDIEYEKELEQVSKKILELQSKIKSLEAQGKSYTKKLEGMLEE